MCGGLARRRREEEIKSLASAHQRSKYEGTRAVPAPSGRQAFASFRPTNLDATINEAHLAIA
jgi:hypothetical protein